MNEETINSIFRQQAIDHLHSIDDSSSTLTIITPSAWICLIAIGLLIVGTLIWAVYGKMLLLIESQGIVLTMTQVETIEQNNKQTLTNYREQVTDMLDLYKKQRMLYHNRYTTLLDLQKSKENYITAKSNLNELEKDYNVPTVSNVIYKNNHSIQPNLVAIVFVDIKHGKLIKPGMKAYILPLSSSSLIDKHIIGTVSGITIYPVSKSLASSYLRNNSLVDSYFFTTTPFMMKITIDANNPTERLSELQPGTAISAKINYETRSPFHLLTNKIH